MYYTRIKNLPSLCFIPLSLLSNVQFFLTILIWYNYCLFIAGIPSFSMGGIIHEQRCTDLLDCAEKLCTQQNVTYTPTNHNCNSTEYAYDHRTPGWLRYEYTNFENLLSTNITVLGVLFCWFIVWVCLVSFIKTSATNLLLLSKVCSSVMCLLNLSSCIVLTNTYTTMNKFKPNLPIFINTELYKIMEVAVAFLWLQVVVFTFAVFYIEVTQVHLDVEEYRPLVQDDVLTWDKRNDNETD